MATRASVFFLLVSFVSSLLPLGFQFIPHPIKLGSELGVDGGVNDGVGKRRHAGNRDEKDLHVLNDCHLKRPENNKAELVEYIIMTFRLINSFVLYCIGSSRLDSALLFPCPI